MNKKRQIIIIFFLGAIWMGVGIMLLSLGFSLLKNLLVAPEKYYPVGGALAAFFGSHESAVILLVALSLAVGYMKAKKVLFKVVQRSVDTVGALTASDSLFKVFGVRYFALIAVMMGLGMGIRFLGVPDDIRGFVDVAVGSALINGAVAYRRAALNLKTA